MHDPKVEVDAAAAHWNQRFDREASVESRGSYYALASPLYQKHAFSPFFSRDGTDWVEWARRTCCPERPFERALVLGCGLGDGLLDFARRGLAHRLHGIDVSATAIEHARAVAAQAGLDDRITFEVGDFHDCPLETGAYDAVWMVMSLHHALDLDRVLSRVRTALAPRGLLIVNEYIGPSRWQHTWPQLFLIKALLTLIPRRLRRRPDGSVKGRIGRPTLAWMMATDPSEAACSAEIPAALARHFELLHRVDYGGGVAVPVLDEIIANFREDEASDMAWFRRVTGTDRLAWTSGFVPSANAVIVGRAR